MYVVNHSDNHEKSMCFKKISASADKIWKNGPYNYDSNTTLSSFPLNLMETSPFANKQ